MLSILAEDCRPDDSHLPCVAVPFAGAVAIGGFGAEGAGGGLS
jgi:hypothetical protein